MNSKPENVLGDYKKFIDLPQPNQKESISNNTNTLPKQNISEIKEEKSNPNILIFTDNEKDEEVNENNKDSGLGEGCCFFGPEHQAFYEDYFKREENEDEKFTEFYDVSDNSQKNP